jgi:H+-transporting ATPase
MATISPTWALAIWGYGLAWFLINDRVKLVACRNFDPPPLM